MKKGTHYILSITVGIITVLFIVLYFPACKRNKDCKAIITVVNASTGAPVSGAFVTLAPTQTAGSQGNLASQTQSGLTDGSGSVTFTFPLPAILQATSKLPSPYTTCLSCPVLVQLEEGKSVSKTLKVQ